MVASGICTHCRGIDLPGFGQQPPRHCHGASDRPAPRGVLGGYRCSCPCRFRPDELWKMADSWAKAEPDLSDDTRDTARILRYGALMEEAGHIVPQPNGDADA